MNNSSNFLPLILASESPSRLEILKACHFYPDLILPSNIDETPIKYELPKDLVQRLSESKANLIAETVADGYIIGADSIVVTGRTVLPKAINDELVAESLSKLSGKRHRVMTAVTIIKKEHGVEVTRKQRTITTIIKFKRLTNEEIKFYVISKEGLNKAGGYAIQGLAQIFVEFIRGSVANIIGLPSFEVYGMLKYLGYTKGKI